MINSLYRIKNERKEQNAENAIGGLCSLLSLVYLLVETEHNMQRLYRMKTWMKTNSIMYMLLHR